MAKKDSLEAIVDEGIFEIYRTQYPGIVDAISDLLAAGATPTQIANHLGRGQANSEILRHIRHIAEHLARIG